jgi:hypothetical protein
MMDMAAVIQLSLAMLRATMPAPSIPHPCYSFVALPGAQGLAVFHFGQRVHGIYARPMNPGAQKKVRWQYE